VKDEEQVPQDSAQFAALMNIAHAIAESTRRVQDQLRPLQNKELNSETGSLNTAASSLFSTLTRAAANDGFDASDRRVLHKIRKELNSIIGHSELLCEHRQLASDHKPMVQELGNDARMLLQELEEAHKTAKNIPASSKTAPGRVLIIDDDDANRLVLARHLQQLGHNVETSSSSKKVFDLLASATFDLIFLDLTMPEVDGLAILTQLKASERWRAIPVVMISGIHDEDSVIQCIEAGADDFLIKPINRVLLNARLNAGLERKRWHDREQRYLKDLEQNHKFIRDTFGRYVSEEIVDSILAQPNGLHLGGKMTRVSILMADIRGFTTMAEKLAPPQVVKMLNNYLGTMSEIIISHRGTIDEFIGDAILAIFGAPINQHDHADRALACALEMQSAVSGINEENQRLGLPNIGIGIAVNSGDVIAGNIGCAKRVKYGVVGHTVNLTARMESFCRAGEILASQETLNNSARKVKHSYQFEINPKGMVERLRVCNIIGLE
jgi:adenylate cyclase